MTPANYDELTLDVMEFGLVNNGKVSYGTTNEVIESMLGIPGLPEAIELFYPVKKSATHQVNFWSNT